MTDAESYRLVLERAPSGPTLGLWGRLSAAIIVLETCIDVRHQRRSLRMMDDHQLKDIGLSRADVECEAARRFWDISKR